ncbi:MAG: ArsC/Spx/MgsR family protein [Kiloniellaceae bacterium]
MIVLYGLKNCDSCRKALKLLQDGGRPHRFHDLRADGLPADRHAHWLAAAGWEALLNRRSTTWRELPEAEKAGPDGTLEGRLDAAHAAALLARHPTLIKRPVVEIPDAGGDDRLVIGFSPAEQAILKALQ